MNGQKAAPAPNSSRQLPNFCKHVQSLLFLLLTPSPHQCPTVPKYAVRDNPAFTSSLSFLSAILLEILAFGPAHLDPTRTHGRRRNRAPRTLGDPNEPWLSVDMVDAKPTTTTTSTTSPRPPSPPSWSDDDYDDDYDDDDTDGPPTTNTTTAPDPTSVAGLAASLEYF